MTRPSDEDKGGGGEPLRRGVRVAGEGGSGGRLAARENEEKPMEEDAIRAAGG
jgi:hypothetical protein